MGMTVKEVKAEQPQAAVYELTDDKTYIIVVTGASAHEGNQLGRLLSERKVKSIVVTGIGIEIYGFTQSE